MSDKWVIDIPEALFCLRRVVYDKGPDFVYEKPVLENWSACVNFNDGKPSCIVGHVFALLGLSYEKASKLQVDGPRIAESSALILSNDKNFPWTFTVGAKSVLGEAQMHQDDGKTWGEALEMAESKACLILESPDDPRVTMPQFVKHDQ